MEHEQTKPPPTPAASQQLELLPELASGAQLLDADTLARMRRHFNRRWAKWHPARRFEVAASDPVTLRLLLLTVQRVAKGGRRD